MPTLAQIYAQNKAKAHAAAVAVALAIAAFLFNHHPAPITPPTTAPVIVSASQPVTPPARVSTVAPVVLAGFDRAPYTEVVDDLDIGVIASAGVFPIDHVDFSVNGGTVTTVATPTENLTVSDPRPAGSPPCLRYVDTVHETDYPAGVDLALKAVITSKAGTTLTLTLPLYNHAVWQHFTLGTDYASIGDACILAPAWSEITVPDGDWEASFTRLNGFRDTPIRFVCLSNARVWFSANNYDPRNRGRVEWVGGSLIFKPGVSYQNSGHSLFSYVRFGGSGDEIPAGAQVQSTFYPTASGACGFYASVFENFGSAPVTLPEYVGGCTFTDTRAHPMNSPRVVVNSYINGVGTDDPTAHMDAVFVQDTGVVIDGLAIEGCEGLCLFGQNAGGSILRNLGGPASGVGIGGASQWGKDDGSTQSNVYVENLNLPNQRFVAVGICSNFVIRGSTALDIPPAPGVTIINTDANASARAAADAAGFDTWFRNVGAIRGVIFYTGEGDYNGDGIVDAGDFDVWFKTQGNK